MDRPAEDRIDVQGNGELVVIAGFLNFAVVSEIVGAV